MQGLEIICSEVHHGYTKVLIGTLYRPTSSLADFWDLLSRIDKAFESKVTLFCWVILTLISCNIAVHSSHYIVQ